jgi:hypothetical protein
MPLNYVRPFVVALHQRILLLNIMKGAWEYAVYGDDEVPAK